ncbi:MAG: hypothetical protein AB7I30_17130 [Isosphaeraceae bacterium]
MRVLPMPRNPGYLVAIYVAVLLILVTGSVISPLSSLLQGCLFVWVLLFFVVSWVVIAGSLVILAGWAIGTAHQWIARYGKKVAVGSHSTLYDRWLDGL